MTVEAEWLNGVLEKNLIETLASCTEDLHRKRAWWWLRSNSKT